MNKEEFVIKNRENLRLPVIVEMPEKKSREVVVIAHGLGAFKEQPQIALFAQTFLKCDFIVVRYDAAHSLGDGGGKMEDALASNYISDLEDVVGWSKKQKWYNKRLILCGHSMGATASIAYAEKYPDEVTAIAPFSPVVSSAGYLKTKSKTELAKWKKIGIREEPSNSKPGAIRRLKWSFIEELQKQPFDLTKHVNALRMPTLILVGEHDETTPLKQIKPFFKKLPSQKELHSIQGAAHTFRSKDFKQIEIIIKNWIKKYL